MTAPPPAPQPPPTAPSSSQSATPSPEKPQWRGAKKFEPIPLSAPKPNDAYIHPQVYGTGYLGLCAGLGWLLILLMPIVSVWMLISGLRKGLTELVNEITGQWTELTDNLFNNLLEMILSGRLTSFDNFDINTIIVIADELGLGDTVTVIFGSVSGGVATIVFGTILLAVSLILMIWLVGAARANYRTGRVLVIFNIVLCAGAGLLYFSVISRIVNLVQVVLQPPYTNIPLIAIVMLVISICLWLGGLTLYNGVISRSNEMQ
jgi:hypothetical protein